jgi:hypothetical protein
MRTDDGALAIVAINTARHAVLLDNIETGATPDTQLAGTFAIDGQAPPLTVDANGRATLVLPPRAGFAWKATTTPADAGFSVRPPSIDALPQSRFGGDFSIAGTATGAEEVRIVVDEDIEHAITVRPRDGRWQAKLDTSAMIDPDVDHVVVAWERTSNNASERRTFRVARAWSPVAALDDPLGDDTGPNGRYTYPADASYEARQGDIERIELSTAGGALRVALRMRALTTPWNPPNGFDHVAFSLFIDLPGQKGGARAMPGQNADVPDEMRWDVRVRANGWSNAMFAAKGASATQDGAPIAEAALLHADPQTRTITFTIPAAALGRAADLSGARVYATTWDYDGGWRALASTAGPHAFGGGDPARDARVLDAVGPIRIP